MHENIEQCLPLQSSILVARSISAVSTPSLDLGSHSNQFARPEKRRDKPYRRYLALPAVVSKRLFQLSLVFAGRPFLNTKVFSSSKRSCAYFSRFACSASSIAFLDTRVVDLAVLGREAFRPVGVLTVEVLGDSLGMSTLAATTGVETPASSIVVMSRSCFEGDRCFGIATFAGFLALFGSSLVRTVVGFQNKFK